MDDVRSVSLWTRIGVPRLASERMSRSRTHQESSSRRRLTLASVRRVLTVLASVLLIGAGTSLFAPGAQAADLSVGALTVNCSWGSCSYYISRSGTKKLDRGLEWSNPAEIAAGLGCLATGPALAGCEAVAGVIALHAETYKVLIHRAVTEHGRDGACFKLTHAHLAPPLQMYPSTNNGRFCKN